MRGLRSKSCVKIKEGREARVTLVADKSRWVMGKTLRPKAPYTLFIGHGRIHQC